MTFFSSMGSQTFSRSPGKGSLAPFFRSLSPFSGCDELESGYNDRLDRTRPGRESAKFEQSGRLYKQRGVLGKSREPVDRPEWGQLLKLRNFKVPATALALSRV